VRDRRVVRLFRRALYVIHGQGMSASDLSQIYTAVNFPSTTATFMVERYAQEATITNMCNALVHATSWLCFCRHDVPFGTIYAGLSTLLEAGFFANGYLNARTDIDSSIFMSANWVDYFKIVKTVKYTINPGQSKTLRYSSRKPRRINTEVVKNANTLALAGLTMCWVTQFNGSAAGDAVSTDHIGVSPASIGCITREKYTYRFVQQAGSKYTNFDNLSGLPNGAVIENDDVGASMPYAKVN